jgi:hypothetical protein
MHDEQMAASKSFFHGPEQPKGHLNESGLRITDRWRLEMCFLHVLTTQMLSE